MDNEQLLEQIRAEFKLLREELIERIADSQTEVLRAFYNWARPVDARLHAMEERLSATESRLLTAEEKLSGLEKRQ